MKRYIKCSAGDITLHKFVLIPMQKLDEFPDNYDTTLHGYFYIWDYTYNTITRNTDDRMYAHSDVIDALPFEIRKQSRQNLIWGKTDWFKDHKRFYINDDTPLSTKQLKYIHTLCNM